MSGNVSNHVWVEDASKPLGGYWVREKGTADGAALVSDQTIGAGDRRPTSTTESYKSVKEDWNLTVVDLSAGSATIYDGPAILGGIWVDVALSAHACPVRDAAVTKFNIPASRAIGDVAESMRGSRFETSLVIAPNASGTGTIVVQWRKL